MKLYYRIHYDLSFDLKENCFQSVKSYWNFKTNQFSLKDKHSLKLKFCKAIIPPQMELKDHL